MISPQQINFLKKERAYFQYKYRDDEEEYIKAMMRQDYKERLAYQEDLIQPDDPRFKTYYKEQWKERERDKEAAHLKEKRIKAERNQFYKDWKFAGQDKVKKALDLEEKLRWQKT